MNDFEKILKCDSKDIRDLLLSLEQSGIMKDILPELLALKGIERRDGKGHKDNYLHTLQVVQQTYEVTDDIWLRLVSILHDIGKAPTKRFDKKLGWTFHNHEFVGSKMIKPIFKRLDLDMSKLKYVIKLVKAHGKVKELTGNDKDSDTMDNTTTKDFYVTDSAIRRFAKDMGDDVDDLILFCKCDLTTKYEIKKQRYVNDINLLSERISEIKKADEKAKWRSPITGQMIMDEYGLGQCREVGVIKSKIETAIKNGDIKDDYDEAYAYMLTLKEVI